MIITELDRTIPPAVEPLADFAFVKPHQRTLSNGAKMYVMSAGVQPVISVQMVFKAARRLSFSLPHSLFVSKMLLEGTRSKTSAQITETVDSLGGHLDFSGGMDYLTAEVHGLSKHLSKLLPLLCEILTESVFPTNELDKIKTIQVQQLKVNMEKTAYLASQTFRQKLLGTHPYGSRLKTESVESVQQADLLAYYADLVQYQPFEVVVAGKITDEDLALIDQTIGKLPIRPSQEIYQYPDYQGFTPETHYEERPDAVQTSLRIGKPLFGMNHPDYHTFSLLNEILGGYFGSRLMSNIREEKGYTYGIHSSNASFKRFGYWIATADVKKEFWKETVKEVFAEIEKLQTENVGEEELETVKNYMAGGLINAMNTPFAIAERFRSIYFYGLPANYYDSYIARIQAISADDIRLLAQKYLSGNFLTVAVG